jgi:hypothetical protein
MTDTNQTEVVSGVEIFVPLNKLKKSPKNARKVPHGDVAIEALAASIQHKRMIQNLVVEPETNEDGTPTGLYLVTAGEGRRLAQLLRAKRKQIKKTEPNPLAPWREARKHLDCRHQAAAADNISPSSSVT